MERKCSPRYRRFIPLAVGLWTVAGTAIPVLGDEDDGKILSKKPAVLGSIFRNPDPWKSLSFAGPVLDQGDSTFPSQNIVLLSWLPLNNFAGFPGPSANGADCWGYTSPSGREYALMGLSWGNGIVEVTNPSSPQIIATIPGGVNVLWRDIDVIGHYAYAVSDSAGVGIQVLNLANIDSGVVNLVRNYSQGGHTTTHTAVANPASGYLYLCGGNAANGGMIPAATTPDPTFPTFQGGGWTTRYVHEAYITSYTQGPYAGREIAFLFTGGSSNGSISIVDVTDKFNLVTLSTIVYPGRSYSHQGWLSADKKYLYHNDEIDGPQQNVPRMLTRIFDVQDLTTPRLVATFSNGLPAVDHNEYVNGRYLYQSNYTTGLRVWDLHDPLRPFEVAYIDTRPEDDGTGYNGAWGNYAYFNSGTILVSDLERGLFIVKLSLLEFTPVTPLPTTLSPGQPTPVSIQLLEKNATLQAAQLMVSVNGGSYQAHALTRVGNELQGSIPAANCTDRVRYYFEAETDDNRAFRWPLRAPTEVLSATAHSGQEIVFQDNFESDLGWTVQNTSVTTGAWTRAVPIYNGGPGAVIGDGDGSGRCFVTGNTLNQDLDGGPTRLISPVFDLSNAPEATVSYWRWVLSIVGTTDELMTEVSNDSGASWTLVGTVGPSGGGWQQQSFRVADYVTPTAQVRVRFSISDNPNNSTTEAGIDGFRISNPTCPVCYANCDQSTTPPVLNVADFACFLQRFAAGEPYANCDNSTVVPVLNVADFACFLQKFAAGCN